MFFIDQRLEYTSRLIVCTLSKLITSPVYIQEDRRNMEEDQIFTRNDCNSSFTEHERNKLIVSWLIPSIISFVMCSTALLLVISLKLYKHFVYRLAVYQVLACLFFSAIGILMMMNINYTKDKFHVVECNIMAFLIHYTIWMNLLFTLCLVFHIFCMVVCFQKL